MGSDTVADTVAELSEIIRNHAEFPNAARRYVVDYVRWRDRLGLLNKVVANAARMRVLENLIYLHYIGLRGEGGRGATFERLADLSGLSGDVGVRAVRTLLRLAQTGGLVIAGRHAEDGRLRIFEPTPALVGQGRDYTIVTLRALDAIYPQLGICARLAADPEFYGALAAKMGRISVDLGKQRARADDPFRDLMRLEGAMPISAIVLDRHFNDSDLPTAAELSRRFFVSQSQARAVLKAAEALGLIRTAPRGRLLDAKPLAKMLFQRYARLLAASATGAFAIEPPAVE